MVLFHKLSQILNFYFMDLKYLGERSKILSLPMLLGVDFPK